MNNQELYNECHRLFSYDAETGLLTRKVGVTNCYGNQHHMQKTKAEDEPGWIGRNGYKSILLQGKKYLAHRIIWLMQTGVSPKENIDHVNGDRADNRFVNLREATKSQNGCNRSKTKANTTGFKGVTLGGQSRKNPYQSQIRWEGKQLHLGRFPTAELAYKAYCIKAKELHGEFASVA